MRKMRRRRKKSEKQKEEVKEKGNTQTCLARLNTKMMKKLCSRRQNYILCERPLILSVSSRSKVLDHFSLILTAQAAHFSTLWIVL